MDESIITIEDFESLIEKINTKEFWVKWKVSSDIGPDWIGSVRTINFYVDEYKLEETEFCKDLKNRLIQLIPIPETSKDHVITGHGDITLKKNCLEIHYDWDATIPYDEPSEEKEGKMVFYP